MANFSMYFKQGLYMVISRWVLIIVVLTVTMGKLFVYLFIYSFIHFDWALHCLQLAPLPYVAKDGIEFLDCLPHCVCWDSTIMPS